MRVTKYVKSDGENWMMVQIRCSAHVAYMRLDKLMTENGWIHWSLVRDKMNALKKKLAAQNPIKYRNWKEVKIPMHAGQIKDLPAALQAEQAAKNAGVELAVIDGASNG